jgi:peptide/nickel transport system substrate-binding protein
MKRIASTFLAVISLAWVAAAATRPHYGGTLRVAVQSAPTAFEMPDASSPNDYEDMARILSLVADTLVNVDALGRPKPALAVAWRGDSTSRHWQFTLRHGVKFHDGSAASVAVIAQILGAFHPDWTVRAVASSVAPDTLTIDTETPTPWLLAELALPRNLLFTRNNSGIPVGTGAFRVADFQSAKSLKLATNEDAWSGRPFLDAIEIEFGKSLRDQAVSMELGRADVIEAPPQSANGSSRVRTSLPVELMALAFSRNTKAQDVRLRQALALCIDRKPIQSVLLKGSAESTASILPNWMTGYSAAFSTQPNQQLAKSLLVESRQPSLTLSYDPRDPQAQLIAERIALNAREAGIVVQVSLSGADDIRLVRIALPSPDPALSLDEMAHQFSLPQPVLHGDTVEDLYQAEHMLLDGDMLIPLFHLPVGSAAGGRVRRWSPDQLGGWNIQDLWLEDSR